jgi:hypothetical protein
VQPQPGDIGLTRIRGEAGDLIRVGQWLNGQGFAPYEHCFVHLGGGAIIEAEPGGARITQLSEYDAQSVVWLRCPPGLGQRVATAARIFEHTPYSAADYLALAAHRLHIPAPGLREFIGASGHMICSQLCDRAAKLGGWNLFSDGRWDGYVTPAAIYGLYRRQQASASA